MFSTVLGRTSRKLVGGSSTCSRAAVVMAAYSQPSTFHTSFVQLPQARKRDFHSSMTHSAKMNVEELTDRVQLHGRNILVRADLDVPLDENNQVIDDSRLQAICPTVYFLREQGANVILCSSFTSHPSIAPIVEPLEKLLQTPIIKLNDCIGPEVLPTIQHVGNRKNNISGQVILLENIHKHHQEEEITNDPQFCQELAKLADYYVNDAMESSHNIYASTVGITQHMLLSVEGFWMSSRNHHPSNTNDAQITLPPGIAALSERNTFQVSYKPFYTCMFAYGCFFYTAFSMHSTVSSISIHFV